MQGFNELPQHCGMMMAAFFGAAIVVNLIRDLLPQRYAVFVPVPMAVAIPFYIGANVAIDICIGAVVKAYWHWTSPATAELKVCVLLASFPCFRHCWSKMHPNIKFTCINN